MWQGDLIQTGLKKKTQKDLLGSGTEILELGLAKHAWFRAREGMGVHFALGVFSFSVIDCFFLQARLSCLRVGFQQLFGQCISRLESKWKRASILVLTLRFFL